ncbi:sigma-70 family RNA polymerase sigma factor [Priestia megaterium]|uniref:sigma-70 family RNA polymerase sigma factor n=1 Tax=Priestia megaterium TaxID=1404 RepID=UPI002FE2D681
MNTQKTIQQFFNNHKKGLNKPIIKEFLKDDKNYEPLIQYILHPTEKNQLKVDTAFKKHFQEIRDIKFYSSLIRFFSIDYDKRVRKLSNRFLLTLDQPIGNDHESTIKDHIVDPQPQIPHEEEKSLSSLVENRALIKGLKTLTDKQLQVLELIYVKDLTNAEIAKKMNSTTQNVCNTHRKAIRKLKSFF